MVVEGDGEEVSEASDDDADEFEQQPDDTAETSAGVRENSAEVYWRQDIPI